MLGFEEMWGGPPFFLAWAWMTCLALRGVGAPRYWHQSAVSRLPALTLSPSKGQGLAFVSSAQVFHGKDTYSICGLSL